MRKKYLVGLVLGVITCVLTACHSHEFSTATCTEPATCECGETEGEVAAHKWIEATCSEAKHCSTCGTIEGTVNEHNWIEANCREAKHCSVCGTVVGEKLEHQLTEATYLESANCTVCGEEVGEPLAPTASVEAIASLQAKMDALVTTYETGNQEAIDRLVEYLAIFENCTPADDEAFVKDMNRIFDFTSSDWMWWVTTIPMAFYNNANLGLVGQNEFDYYIYTDSATVNSYMEVVQKDLNNMSTDGIILLNTMPYIKEIAIGNPIVLDIVEYEEPKELPSMSAKAKYYGVIDVNGKTYIAELIGETKVEATVLNIYPNE